MKSNSVLLISMAMVTESIALVASEEGKPPGGDELIVEIDTGDTLWLSCNESTTIYATASGGYGDYDYTCLNENGDDLFPLFSKSR
ncbi:MAG: hypothetical protein SH856_07370 [Flavobacteriales bacterium]|nr:hypothetical protein [Flavobacteriales bacterium]